MSAQTPSQLSLIGYGLPSDPRTMSGYAQSLHATLSGLGRVREEYTIKQLRPMDIVRGAFRFRNDSRHRAEIRRAWLWSENGCRLLSERLKREIQRRNDPGPFLQIGTLARLGDSLGPQYMWTDMTIAQARRAKSFAVGELSPSSLDAAERVQTRSLAEAAGVFVNCQWAADSVVADCGVPSDKVHVVYAGGNLEFSEASSNHRREAEILFVGRDWERKGGPLLVEAFTRVRKKFSDAQLTVAGCKPAKRIPGMKVIGPLDVRRPTERKALQDLFLRATCLGHPAGFDPFPNVLIEAAWAGLPVVTISTGSRGEAVLDGETGYLVADADADQLAEAFIRVLSDRDSAREMGRLARERAQDLFSWERIAERIWGVVANGRAVAPNAYATSPN